MILRYYLPTKKNLLPSSIKNEPSEVHPTNKCTNGIVQLVHEVPSGILGVLAIRMAQVLQKDMLRWSRQPPKDKSPLASLLHTSPCFHSWLVNPIIKPAMCTPTAMLTPMEVTSLDSHLTNMQALRKYVICTVLVIALISLLFLPLVKMHTAVKLQATRIQGHGGYK